MIIDIRGEGRACVVNKVPNCGTSGKESACQGRRRGFHPWSGRAPGEGNRKPLQYPCLGETMDRGAWWATVHGVGVASSLIRLSN